MYGLSVVSIVGPYNSGKLDWTVSGIEDKLLKLYVDYDAWTCKSDLFLQLP